MNGCDYEYELKGTFGENKYNLTTTFECPAGKHIQVTVFTGASHALRACTITITEKTDYDGLRAINTPGKGDFDIAGTIEGLEADQSNEFGCTKPGQTTKEVVLHVDITVEGRNSAGQATEVSLSHF